MVRVGTSDGVTHITTADVESITIREMDLAQELIGHLSFSEFFFLMLCGRRPTETQRAILDAVLIAIAEHGITPSVAAARMTLAAAPEALQGAVAAGILGCGNTVLGTTEVAGRFLAAGVRHMRESGKSAEAVAGGEIRRLQSEGKRLPGFGHPLHRPVDPRCERLLLLAEELGCAGVHVAYARAVKAAADKVFGKPMVMNVSTAIPAVLLDLDFPIDALRGIPILARTAGLIAHLAEERQHPIGFNLAAAAAESAIYIPAERAG